MCQGKTGGDAALALFSRQALLVGDSLPATQRNAEGEINARLTPDGGTDSCCGPIGVGNPSYGRGRSSQ